jgi:hypothetical protein
VRGSHTMGRLDREEIEGVVATQNFNVCLAKRGDVLAIRPLILHRSQKARQPLRRRVLHLEYSPNNLPPPLQWAIDAN